MRKPTRESVAVVEKTPTADYVAARLYLMVEALCDGRVMPGSYVLAWASKTIDDLDISEETMDEAIRDHQEMVGDGDGVE